MSKAPRIKNQEGSEVLDVHSRAAKRVKYTDDEMAARIQHLSSEIVDMRKERKRQQREIYFKTEEKRIIPETMEELVLKTELARLRGAYKMRMRRNKQKDQE